MALNILKTGIDLIDRTFQNIKDALDGMQRTIVTGNRLTSVVLDNGSTAVAHGLNRAAVGFIVISKNAPADIYLASAQVGDASKQITLASTALATVDLWVF